MSAKKIVFLVMLISLLASGVVMSTKAAPAPAFPTSRNASQWPFVWNSIWNMPIGSGAQYTAVNFTVPKQYAGDEGYVHTNAIANPPVVTDAAGNPVAVDSGQWVNVNSGENRVLTLFESNGEWFRSIQPGNRKRASGNFTGWMMIDWTPAEEQYPGQIADLEPYERQSIKTGKGVYGAHWGSGLSSWGGHLRTGELIGSEPIHHALSLEISSWKWLTYVASDTGYNPPAGDLTKEGYRWPAAGNDVAAPTDYKGNNPALRMGALLAIPPSVDINALGLTSVPGKKIAQALQDYGGYITDDSFGAAPNDIFNINYIQGVNEEFQAAYGYAMDPYWTHPNQPYFNDLDKIVPLLQVVSNNGPNSIGGGGTPRAPYAPCFTDGTGCPPGGTPVPTNTPTATPTKTPTPVPGSWVIVDDTASGWTWSGWTQYNETGDYGGTGHGSAVNAHYGQYTFTGTSVEVYAWKGSNGGSLQIFIDGVSKGTFSQKNATALYQQLIYSNTTLSSGSHTVKIVAVISGGKPGSKWDMVDYIRYK